MGRITMVDSALETLRPNVYPHVLNRSYGQLEISLSIEISMGLSKNLKNQIFQILKFCFHEVTFKANLARSECAMDMVDGALKTLGLSLLKHNYNYTFIIRKAYLAETLLHTKLSHNVGIFNCLLLARTDHYDSTGFVQ